MQQFPQWGGRGLSVEGQLAAKTYSEKLRDPRWQKMRLEILNRDDFTCQFCEDKDSTLHVHHIEYVFGKEPWDYNPVYLITLCETCHQDETDYRKDSNKTLSGGFALAGTSHNTVHGIGVGLYELISIGERKLAKQLAEEFSEKVFLAYNEKKAALKKPKRPK